MITSIETGFAYLVVLCRTSGVASNSIMSDRSCHVTVANGTRSTNLTMVEYKDVHGDWVGRPKALITPGQTDDGIHLKDNFRTFDGVQDISCFWSR